MTNNTVMNFCMINIIEFFLQYVTSVHNATPPWRVFAVMEFLHLKNVSISFIKYFQTVCLHTFNKIYGRHLEYEYMKEESGMYFSN